MTKREVIDIGHDADVHLLLVAQPALKGGSGPRLHFSVFDSSTGKEVEFTEGLDHFGKLENLAAISRLFNELFLARLEALKTEAGW